MSERDDLGNTLLSAVPRAPGKPADGEHELPAPGDPRFTVPDGVIDPELGHGGMGRVVRLFDPHLGREVAVKELLGQHRDDAAIGQLFVREAKVLARLEHPGVVPIYEIGRKADGTPFYAMRRIRGDSLSTVLNSCASLEDRLALLGHYLDVVQTMGYAHSHGVVHRDLKPDNVMVSRFGETLVIDWGLAVVDGDVPEGMMGAGTPTYMSPEQATGSAVDQRSDVWSLGVMLYELLTGAVPFEGGTATEILAAVTSGKLVPILEREPKAPAGLVKVAERALQADRFARYASAGEMADAVEEALRPRLATTRTPTLVAVGLAGALAVALGWGLWQVPRVENARRDARLAVGDAERARNDALADSALRALRDHDAFTASKLAAQAEAHPLARGVELLAREAGVPTRGWTVLTEAGCSSLAVVDELVACGTLNEVALFHLADGTAAGSLKTGPRGWQQGVAALPEHRLATGGDDRIVRIFDVPSGKLLSESPAFADSITALAADGENLAVGLRTGAVLGKDGELQHHARPVLQIVASHSVIASTSGASLELTRHDGTSTLDRRAGAVAFAGDSLLLGVERTVALVGPSGSSASWGTHHHDVTAVAVFPSGEAVSGSADGELRWWTREGELLASAALFSTDVRALLPAGDSVLVVSGRTLEAWSFKPSRGPVWSDAPTAVRFSAGKPEVYAGFRDGRVRRAELDGAEAPVVLELRHTAPVRAIVEVGGLMHPEGYRLLTGGDDGKVLAQRWNGDFEVLGGEPKTRVLALAVAPDGERAAWTLDDGTVVVHSLKFEKEIFRQRGSLCRALAFSPDGARLAMGRDDKRVAILKAESGATERESEAFDATVSAVAWTGPGAVAVGRTDGAVSELDASSGAQGHQWTGAGSAITALSVSGNRLAAGTHDGQAWVWNVERGGAPDYRVPADSGDVRAVGFSAEALLLAGTDRLVHVLGR